MFTVITTYYEEPFFLKKFIKTHADANYDVIVVDDGSKITPAINIFNSMHFGKIKLFRAVEDLGFNSHGCRNLAMQQSKTQWNILVDIDYQINSINKLLIGVLNKEVLYAFPVENFKTELPPTGYHRKSINDFVVTKDLFWRAGGYDTEFTGAHYGDRLFIRRMTSGKNVGKLLNQGVWLRELRSPHCIKRIIKSDQVFQYSTRDPYIITTSTSFHDRLTIIDKKVKQERAIGVLCGDPVPFKWEQQL